MSRDDLRSLLDDMLSDAGERFEEQDAEARRAREPETVTNAPDASGFADVEQLRVLADVSLCKVLAAAPRDEILTLLAAASDGLRRKVLTNLSHDAVKWMQQNLEYFEEPTRALVSAAHRKVLGVANRLLEQGAIELPASGGEGAGTEVVPDEVERIGAVIVELLERVKKLGRKGLADVVGAGGDPLLEMGLRLVAQGADEATIATELDGAKQALLVAYARRLAVIEAGILALHAGEDPDAFRRRLESIE